MKRLWGWFFLVAVSLGTARGETEVGYWDLNNTLARSSGSSGVLSAELEGFGPEYISYGTGTSVNLQPGFSAGESLRFSSLATILETGHVTVSHLNFTSLSTPTFSFAAKSSPAFQLGDVFKLEYNSGAGWVTAALLAMPSTSYSLFTHTFAPGILDDLPDVHIRMTFSTIVDIADVFDVDNVKVTAVPETSAFWLLGSAGILAGIPCILRRKRASSF